MRALVALAAAGVLFSVPAWARPAWAGSQRTVYVDCAAPPGGDGGSGAPFDTITGALPDARSLAATWKVTIDVAPGTCDRETFPIPLDFSVTLRGASASDTVITWSPPDPVPSSVGGVTFIQITGPDVSVSDLALDGNVPIGEDGTTSRPPTMPTGIYLEAAERYHVDRVRITAMTYCVRSQTSSGSVTRSTLGPAGSGLFAWGGAGQPPPQVAILGNRVIYRVNGIAIAGAGVTGDALRLLIAGNELVTEYTSTGPTNPAAVRLSPVGGTAVDGTLTGLVAFNRLNGAPRYGIIVHGGPFISTRGDGTIYTGEAELAFLGNALDPAVQKPSLVTFTNARGVELPCELNPECSPARSWEYLEGSDYLLWHTGELDGALIDFPELHPLDGHVLDDRLYIDRDLVDYQTFVVVP